MDADVPLLIPEINADHLGAIERQRKRRGGNGYIVTNPNCSTIGLAMAIAPIERRFGIDQLHVTTMQAISGAGYAGVSSYAILDNVIPYIGGGEEEKIETEPRKILGTLGQRPLHRRAVPHLRAGESRADDRRPSDDDLAQAARRRRRSRRDPRRDPRLHAASRSDLNLPSAPKQPIHYVAEPDRPQPRLDRDRERGMAVTVGRLRPCPLLDIRMVALVHNTIRGAAGAALLNAELLDAKGCCEQEWSVAGCRVGRSPTVPQSATD